MTENNSKSKRISNTSNSDHKKLKSDSLEPNINGNYVKNLDELSQWYSCGVENDKQLDSLSNDVQLIRKPFKLMRFKNFIESNEYLFKLKQELNQLDFIAKNNDLYQLRQSIDLNNIKNGSIGKLCELFRNIIKPFMEQLTDISLNDNIALTVSKYEQNDYLLCHDDELEGRRIAFILYLVPEWSKSDGGSLDLFDCNQEGQPEEVVESVIPEWNSFAFFEVNPISFHQVSEVISDSKIRLSINGWFHGQPIVRPKPFLEPQYQTHEAMGIPLEVVQSWINPLYLEDFTQLEIQTRFEELSEIVLQDFFNEDKYNELARALKDSEAIQWQWNKPPNMRKYETALISSVPAIALEAFELFKSEALFLILSNLTGLKLHELAINNGSDSDDNDEDSERSPRCRGEIRRWSQSCYTLVHDHSAELNEEPALDVVIHFNCDNELDRDNGGFISYIAKGEDEELLTIDPSSNSLNVVYREKNTARFVKYLNNKCQENMHDISFVYYQ